MHERPQGHVYSPSGSCSTPPPKCACRSGLCQPGDHPARLRVLHRHPGLGPLLPVLQLPGGAAMVALQQHVEHPWAKGDGCHFVLKIVVFSFRSNWVQCFVCIHPQRHVSSLTSGTWWPMWAACWPTQPLLSWSFGSEWSFLISFSFLFFYPPCLFGIKCVCVCSRREVLHLTAKLDELGPVNWRLAVCLAIIWLVCYFCVWKGVKSTGKVSRKHAGFNKLQNNYPPYGGCNPNCWSTFRCVPQFLGHGFGSVWLSLWRVKCCLFWNYFVVLLISWKLKLTLEEVLLSLHNLHRTNGGKATLIVKVRILNYINSLL